MFHGFGDSLLLKLTQHQVDCPHGTRQSLSGIFFSILSEEVTFYPPQVEGEISSIMAISKGCWFKNAFLDLFFPPGKPQRNEVASGADLV